METSEMRRWIRQAREAVQDEPEPYKLEAFKVILSKLIEQHSLAAVLPPEVTRRPKRAAPGSIPDRLLEGVSKLTNKEKIQALLYFAGRPLTKEEVRERTRDLGIDEGWWNGSNFKRDLMKRSRLLVEEKDEKGTAKYRLSNVAKASTKKLAEGLPNFILQ